MTKDEALKLALEALESCGAGHITDGGNQWYDEKLVDKAITVIKQARDLNKMAAVVEPHKNARELGLDYEPVAPVQRCTLCNYQHGHAIGCKNNPVDIALAKLAQPAPMQEHQINQLEKFKNHVLANADALGVVLDAPTAPVQEPVDIYRILACSVECSVFENQVAPVLELNGFGQKAAPNLEQPKPKYWTRKRMGYDREYCEKPFTTDWEPLYTTPPTAQRQWVGLTDEEITALKRNGERYISSQDFARAIEAKLKELNT